MSQETKYLSIVSTVVLGIGTGLALSYPVILRRSVATLDVKHRLAVWQGSYNAGVAAIVPVPLAGAVGFATSAVMAHASNAAGGVIPLSIAAGLSCCHILFTMGFMIPTNKRLMDLNKRVTSLTDAEVKDADVKMKDWYGYHVVRVASLLAATSVGAFGVAAL